MHTNKFAVSAHRMKSLILIPIAAKISLQILYVGRENFIQHKLKDANDLELLQCARLLLHFGILKTLNVRNALFKLLTSTKG